MYVIIWEYQVKAERVEKFAEIYGARGEWTELFQKQNGYLGTELLRDPQNYQRYITIDRWNSMGDYESFLSEWKEEYATLDLRCEGLTVRESLLGKWESIDYETR